MGAFAFPSDHRLLEASHYKRVFDSVEAKASDKYVLLLATRNTLPYHRLGLIVAKKNVRLAVQRNRFKRITREVFRHQACNTTGLDIVVMARKGVDRLDNDSLSTILRQQWLKLG